MSHTILLSDEAYEAITQAAQAHQQTPEALVEAFARALEETPLGPPMSADEFAHALGFSDEEIAQAVEQARRLYPEVFTP
jgi:fructose-bisphosphate aldolase class 1